MRASKILLFFGLLLCNFLCINCILEELELERIFNETDGLTPVLTPGSSRSTVSNHGATKNLPNILMRKQKVENSDQLDQPVNLDPHECVDTTFFHLGMSKSHFPTADNLNDIRQSDSCTWNFIGAEACIPQVSCPGFNLPDNCKDFYMSISDGNGGFEKFCAKDGPNRVVASNSLRDLYIRLLGGNSPNVVINCTVECTHRGVGNPLKRTFKPKKHKRCSCGIRSKANRIVNGYRGTKSEYPWLVAVVEAKTRQPFCGGSIINDRFILTAAHCFKGKYMDYRRVQFLAQAELLDVTPNTGVTNMKAEPRFYSPEELARVDKGNDTIRFSIEEIFIHPLYVSETNDFDVALVKTVETINIKSPTLVPICMPPIKQHGRTFAKEVAIVAGWGLQGQEAEGTSQSLQKLNITVFSPKECKQFYSSRVNKRMMCAGYAAGGRDSCMGDSGGPLSLETRKIWMQIGTVSWGEGCALANNPGVYIRTTEVSQWINHISNLHGATWCDIPPLLDGKLG